MPRATVVTATYGRGRHILPTLRSALAQTVRDIEHLVMGDGCADDTEAAVRSMGDARLRWLNLPANSGSQAAPNNAAIAAAASPVIAYLGHDDVWAPDHLEALLARLDADPGLAVAVSGCALHAPGGLGYAWITGLFEDPADALRHFFPPTSIAHRRALTDRVGPWGVPSELGLPIDSDLELRAARAGLRFASTGRVTAHKFTSTQRYLSYLVPESDEQEAMLARLAGPGLGPWLDALLAAARAEGRFMAHLHRKVPRPPGELARGNARLRGLRTPDLLPLHGPLVIAQDSAPRALDWLPFAEGERRLRWRGQTPAPRLLVPVVHEGAAGVHLQVAADAPATLHALRLESAGAPLPATPSRLHRLTPTDPCEATLSFRLPLRPDAPTVLTLRLQGAGPDTRFAVGEMLVDPAPGPPRLAPAGLADRLAAALEAAQGAAQGTAQPPAP